MSNWAFDIDRQGAFDLWCWVCVAAVVVLAFHLVLGMLTRTRQSWFQVLLCLLPIPITLGLFLLVVFGPAVLRAASDSTPAARDLMRWLVTITPLLSLVWTTLLLLIVSLVQYLELTSKLKPRKIALLLSIRTVALVLAVPMLFEPVLRFTSRKDPDRPLLLLVDASGSMSVPDVQNGPARLQSVSQALGGQWNNITARFKPSVIPFATSSQTPIERPQQLASMPADGEATDLVSAVGKALSQIKRDDAEIVLISDGLDNASADVAGAVRASRKPIHTVLVGSEQARPMSMVNVAIGRVDAGDEWTVRSAATIKVNVDSSSLGGRLVEVKLAEIDEEGRPTGTPLAKPIELKPTPGGQEVSFDFTPQRTGVHRMSAWVDPVAGERSTADNKRIFQQLATDARVKVLYVEGRARPEYRELARALARDGTVEVATLLRVAGDRFSAGGGIDGKPVDRMPGGKTEDWRRFDVIIVGDLQSSFLAPDQLRAIEQAVSEGSGFMMLGGESTFGPGGYGGTPIERVLPVALGSTEAKQERSEFVPKITPQGETHPSMTGLAEWFDGKAGGKLPTLLGNVIVTGPKTGADVLLIHEGRPAPDGKPQIILAAQRYGKGRAIAFTADTTYRWYLPMRGMGQQSPYTIFWGQLVRWLAGTDVKNRGTQQGVETLVDKQIFALGETVRVRALVRDQKGDATRFAQVSIKLWRVGGTKDDEKTLPLSPMSSHDGMYDLSIPNLGKGEWKATVTAMKDGVELGKQPITFSVIPPADEMLKLAADPALMQKIASETGGYAYTLAQLPQLIDLLTRKGGEQALVEQRAVPLHNAARAMLATVGVYPGWPTRFDLPAQTLVVVTLLVIEWVLRRRWQLL